MDWLRKWWRLSSPIAWSAKKYLWVVSKIQKLIFKGLMNIIIKIDESGELTQLTQQLAKEIHRQMLNQFRTQRKSVMRCAAHHNS